MHSLQSESRPAHRLGTMLQQSRELVTAAGQAWLDDRAPTLGAALAYYTLFSMAPLLLIVVSVAGLLFGEEAARGELFNELHALLGPASASTLQSLLESANQPAKSISATLIGVVLMLLGATSVFAELQSTLDHIWRAPSRNSSGILALLRARLLSFGLILGIGFLLIVSLLVNTGLSALYRWWSPHLQGWEVAAMVVNQVFGFVLLTAMFAMIYKMMPRVSIQWRDVIIGALVTTGLFEIGKWAIGVYIGTSAVGSAFGAAGSLVAILVWVYYSAQIFLLGAEFTWIYANTLGSHRHGAPAARLRDPTRPGIN